MTAGPFTPTIPAYNDGSPVQSTDEFIIERPGVGTLRVSGIGSGNATTYLAAFDFLGGTPPTTSEVMGIHSFPVSVTFPGNFTGSTGYIQIDPTATVTAIISDTGGPVGTMVVSNTGVYSFTTTSGSPITFGASDAMIVTAPASADATAANFGWTMLGNLT